MCVCMCACACGDRVFARRGTPKFQTVNGEHVYTYHSNNVAHNVGREHSAEYSSRQLTWAVHILLVQGVAKVRGLQNLV